jgi:hypothetical protein
MIKKLAMGVIAAGLFFACGCESVNQGAKAAGEPVGGAMRVPNSFSEGAAQGVAGQPSPNPYGR